MCEEDNFFIREFELHQLSVDACSGCLLKRSNAVRRRHYRPLVKNRSEVKFVQLEDITEIKANSKRRQNSVRR